jgi:hypothetical protein
MFCISQNGQKVVEALGHTYVDCERSREAITQAEMATAALSQPDCVYFKRSMHEDANDTLSMATTMLSQYCLD